MTWPPQSPNPTEMFWDELDRRVNKRQPTSAQHLWELLQDSWKTIPGDYLMNLRVSKAVIKATGGYFAESKILNISIYYIILLYHICLLQNPYVFLHNFDVFSISLKYKK